MSQPLLKVSPAGLFCPQGEFFIDPRQPVDRAIVTHAHADHARKGCRRYLTSKDGERMLRTRLMGRGEIETIAYGECVEYRGVRVSLHPAGHILGSSQVRVEYKGEVWVVSGDYKVGPDVTCAAFEPIRCHTFITEATFAKPYYRWPDQQAVFAEINTWWRENQRAKRASLLFAYSLGKAQRLIAGVDAKIGPMYAHPDVEAINIDYRATGIPLPPTPSTLGAQAPFRWHESLVIAPPSAVDTHWARQFGERTTAFASGWMLIPSMAERRGFERGFVLSDHADWEELLWAIEETGAERVYVTHGDEEDLIRELTQRGIRACALSEAGEGVFQQSLFR